MSATQCPTKPAASEGRDANGKFLNRPGPGRPSKRLLDLRSRYKAETTNEELRRLADDVERLAAELTQADEEIEDAEHKFLESVSPMVKHREEIALVLGRARVAQYYLADPWAFGGDPSSVEVAKREYRELAAQLADAERELELHPDPGVDRVQSLMDADKWNAAARFEAARDRVSELAPQVEAARRALESLQECDNSEAMESLRITETPPQSFGMVAPAAGRMNWECYETDQLTKLFVERARCASDAYRYRRADHG